MDIEEAKLILQSIRPVGQDTEDPHFQEALAMVDKDPTLKDWFQEQRALDATIGRKLRDFKVPSNLRDRILASRTPPRVSLHRRRGLEVSALAACFLLLAAVAAVIYWPSDKGPESRFQTFQSAMAKELQIFPHLEVETDKLAVVQQWIQRKPELASVQIPSGLHPFPALGCLDLAWQGQTVAMVCFMVDGEVVHLFILPRTNWPETPFPETPVYAKAGSMTSAYWTRKDIIYLALSKGPESTLRKVL